MRKISTNTSFSLQGATQVPFAARLVMLMDQGHGLIDRFLITFLKCLRPSPQETNQAVETFKKMRFQVAKISSLKLLACIHRGQVTH